MCVSVWTWGEVVRLTGRVWADSPSVSVTIQTADAALLPCSDLVWSQGSAEQFHTVNPTSSSELGPFSPLFVASISN